MSRKFLLWLILVVAIVISALTTYYAINPFLNQLLKKQVEQKLIGNFSYSYDTIEVNLLKRSVALKNVSWKFPKDSSKLNHKGHVKLFKVEGISFGSLFGRLAIKNLLIESPEFNTKIEVNQLLNKKEDSLRLEQFDFYELIKGQLESLAIENIFIDNAQAKWYSPDFKTIWREVEGGSLSISDLRIDSTNTKQRNGMFDLEQFQLSFNKAKIYLSDSLHIITLGKTSLNMQENTVMIDSLKMRHFIKKAEIKKYFKYEKTAIDLLIPEILLSGLDYQKLFTEQSFDIKKIALNNLNLQAFKDKNAIEPSNRLLPLPQMLIQQLSKKLKIDSVFINNAFISYTQRTKARDLDGYIFFDKLNASISPLTNDSIHLSNNPISLFQVNTRLYGKSLLAGRVYFDMTSSNHLHTVDMELAPFDLKEANQMLTPVMAYSIRSGQLNKLKFKFNAEDKSSSGNLNFLYENLKIDKLDSESLEKNTFDEQFFSMIANGFVIKTANPDWLGKERKGIIDFDRKLNKSIFHYWWYSVLSGLKTVATPSQ